MLYIYTYNIQIHIIYIIYSFFMDGMGEITSDTTAVWAQYVVINYICWYWPHK